MKKLDLNKEEKVQHPFTVKDGYFEELNSNISERISSLESEGKLSSFRLKSWGWRYSVSFAMVILVVGAIFFINYDKPQQQDYLAGITDEEILIYLSDYDLSDEELAVIVGNEDEEILIIEEDPFEDLSLDEDELDDLYYQYEFTEELIEI